MFPCPCTVEEASLSPVNIFVCCLKPTHAPGSTGFALKTQLCVSFSQPEPTASGVLANPPGQMGPKATAGGWGYVSAPLPGRE